VHNPDYEQGLGSSIRCALAASDADYLFISHGDLPCIPREVYQQLWQA
ncbi:NTP transferase domain-containing protein, partial [Aeromonas veronii]